LNIDIVMRVPFQRSCLFKKVIESGTQKQLLQTYTTMADALKPALVESGTQQQVLQTYTAMVDVLKPALMEVLQPDNRTSMHSLFAQ
ncbi:hypothetical protein DUNSADRAFT_18464, partial [Dunaliella salina]